MRRDASRVCCRGVTGDFPGASLYTHNLATPQHWEGKYMAPEEEVPAEVPVEVIAGDQVEAPEEVTVEGDTTVIVETPAEDGASNDAVEAVVVDTVIDQATELAELRATVEAQAGRIAELELGQAITEIEVDALAERDVEIVEATDAAIVETIEDAEIEDGGLGEPDEIQTDETEPVSHRVHWMFRPGRELFSRDK
jgi:hypothetical protein